jgi:hypothetical protein
LSFATPGLLRWPCRHIPGTPQVLNIPLEPITALLQGILQHANA